MLVKYIVLPEKSAYSKVFSVKPEPISTLWYMLHDVVDFRRGQGKRHDLPLVLTLAILALCCGQTSYQAMSEWCENYQAMLVQFVPFLAGHLPVSATFHRILKKLDAGVFEAVIGAWLQIITPAGQGEGIAIDGKSLHGTSFHLVAAFAHTAESVLFQMSTETKGKELVVAPQLLKHLRVQGQVITGDALFTQRNLCEQIVAEGGGYVFRVKGNQDTLEKNIRLFFKEPPFGVPLQTNRTKDLWKGQKEIREVAVSDNRQLLSYLNWPGLTHVWQMKKTVVKKNALGIQETITTISVGIASIPETIIQPETIAEQISGYIRGHWSIENRLHRQRDVVFNEDHATIRCGNAPQVMAILKNIVVSVFHRATVRNFKTAQRRFAAKPPELFSFLGLTQQYSLT